VPATRLGELVERRAAAARSAHPVAHLRYPGAGHAGVGVPGTPAPTEVRHPVDGASYALGGMPAANAAARADSWPRVLAFLAAGLRGAGQDGLTRGSSRA
jgi:dienelactone hydrolase